MRRTKLLSGTALVVFDTANQTPKYQVELSNLSAPPCFHLKKEEEKRKEKRKRKKMFYLVLVSDV